ncbi:Esterase/lipase [Xaviernesmea oryzae]|uniref:Esterase/lipase n=1 Tax=Xaviernesmea oryzae TaxID=464029 RepID=A0A1X7E0T7_9HYPH|nr:alpha/beta fold hydrolase [Xaviernesmea oryzae]SMF25426.1 Esterase/lipase [Xaviernesmea oryzae]
MPLVDATRTESCTAPEGTSEALSAESRAALRQLTHQRLVGYGMDYGDATKLRELVEKGRDWMSAALAVAREANSYLEAAGSLVTPVTKRSILLRASAATRMAQIMMLSDTQQRSAIYGDAASLFAGALALDGIGKRVVLGAGHSKMIGWHYRAASPARAIIIVVGGVEGWAMDGHVYGEIFTTLGLDVLLVDGPGQGESRLSLRHYLNENWLESLKSAVDYASSRNGVERIGVLGNSVGGNFAMMLSAADRRIAACCNNGAILVPLDMRTRQHFFPKLAAFCGTASEADMHKVWDGITVTPERISLSCPFLVLHGEEDPLLNMEQSKAILGWVNSSDKELVVVKGADHCLCNRPAEKYEILADWFASRLLTN